jgi:hypothetical protein
MKCKQNANGDQENRPAGGVKDVGGAVIHESSPQSAAAQEALE